MTMSVNNKNSMPRKLSNPGKFHHGLGKGMVKGMNVNKRSYEDHTDLKFKLNHVHSNKLHRLLSIKHKKDLIKSIKDQGLVKTDSKGKKTILNVPADKFIHVGNDIKAHYFKK